MSFYKHDAEGRQIRNRVQLVTPDDEEIRVEQSHKDEVNINNIVKRHGMELIAKTAALQQFTYDNNPNNDFQESMNAILQAKESFSSVPSEIRKRFDNNPAKFMDFIHNPDNQQELQDMGLAQRPTPDPVLETLNAIAESVKPAAETPPET